MEKKVLLNKENSWRCALNRKDKDIEDFDYLSESIRNTVRYKHELSICDDREEIDTIYSELDKSI